MLPSAGLARRPWSVAELVGAVAEVLGSRFGACTVQGEISGFSRAASGHCYFTLKDADRQGATLRCAMFRRSASLLGFVPADGQQVDVRGRVGVYEPRGELQFVAEAMQTSGLGALYEQFLRRKAELEALGLFDPARKRSLPRHPRVVGVVTSLDAAALRDVIAALVRRAPHVGVIVYPSPVQGATAPAALAEALALASRRAEVDVLLLCRGGGSLEDLWAFNDERVVRAIVATAMPVVSGIGHETDVTLADFAADLRAPTPTAAAEMVASDRAIALDALASLGAALGDRARAFLDLHGQRLDRAALRLARPSQAVARQHQRLGLLAHRLAERGPAAVTARRDALRRLDERLARSVATRRSAEASRLASSGARLEALNPARVLARGFAWLSDAGARPVASVAALAPGASVRAVLHDGSADLRVLATETTPADASAADS